MIEEDDPNLYFWLKTGKPLRTLKELYDYLPNMRDDEFTHHVDEFKNDFANWISHVLKDDATAKKAKGAKTKQALRKAIEDKAVPPEQEAHDKTLDDLGQNDDKGAGFEGEEGASYRESLAERFDQAKKRMEEGLKEETPEHIEERITKLDERAQDLQQKLSEARKEGHDPFFADIKLRRYRTFLNLAKATEEEADFKTVEELLDTAEQELEEAKKEAPINVKKEVDALAAQK